MTTLSGRLLAITLLVVGCGVEPVTTAGEQTSAPRADGGTAVSFESEPLFVTGIGSASGCVFGHRWTFEMPQGRSLVLRIEFDDQLPVPSGSLRGTPLISGEELVVRVDTDGPGSVIDLELLLLETEVAGERGHRLLLDAMTTVRTERGEFGSRGTTPIADLTIATPQRRLGPGRVIGGRARGSSPLDSNPQTLVHLDHAPLGSPSTGEKERSLVKITMEVGE